MGSSELKGNAQNLTAIYDIIEDTKDQLEGTFKENVYGTYVHGIFDEPKVVKTIVTEILKEKGLDFSKVTSFSMEAYKEKQYDLLAEAIRASCDMEKIYEIVEKGQEYQG